MGSVSYRHIICAEIVSVTTVMRRNSRWANTTVTLSGYDSALASSLGLRIAGPSHPIQPSGRGGRERDLMSGFQVLKRTVQDADDVLALPLTTVLAPFLAIIRSPLSTGPITSAALSSVHAFFQCELIRPEAPGLEPALAEMSNTVSNCKFEASDSSGDEAVLLKIMSVIEDCMCGNVGRRLGDVEVCEMLETVLTTCCQMRLSEILRRSAELTIHNIVRKLFGRLQELDPEIEEEKLQQVKMTVQTDVRPSGDGGSEAHSDVPADASSASAAPTPELQVDAPYQQTPEYGLPAIVELMRVLVNILDPNDKLHTDSTRLVSLRILNEAFETSGTQIGQFPSLSALVVDHGCKYLFQLARSDNTTVLHFALRTISVMFQTMPTKLKLQQELFLAFTIDRLAPPIPPGFKPTRANSANAVSRVPSRPGTPQVAQPSDGVEDAGSVPARPAVAPARGETRELMLETLSQIARQPSLMVDLYTNYDCDINCENLFSRLIDFLVKGVYPSPYSGPQEPFQRNAQFICLEVLLAFVNHMTVRAHTTAEPWPSNWPTPEELKGNKSRKNLVMAGAARFNQKPKAGLAFLEENGLIYADLGPDVTKAQSLARFLKSCTRIDKRLLGDFISKPDNIEILKAFIGLFDFKGKPIAEALREMLETFRLPGESQQISRITETFAEIYFASGPAEIKNQDAVYVLSYSVIMLNTDLHNPQIRKRMSFEDYQRNLRGVNDGANFSDEFLHDIYNSIRKREIVMPEEHTGQLGFEYAWKELLTRSRQAGDLMMCNTSQFDADMFKAVWTPVISAIAHAFITFDDDYVIERAISGFRQCATLAGHFQMPDVFDYIVVSLSPATNLVSDGVPAKLPNYAVVDVDGQQVTVSSLSVEFGTNVKAQLAAVVLFNIVNGNGNALREGWTQIFEMFQTLFLHTLLPKRMLHMEDFLGGTTMIPLRGSQPARPAPRNEGGLLSALSSYLMTPYGASSEDLVPEASETDIENTLSTIDCIAACRLDELYGQITQLNVDALVAALKALEALAHERTVARLKQESDEVGSVSPALDGWQHVLPYDPASVFLLETMVSIASQTPQHIEETWSIIVEHITLLLSNPTQYSILLIERAVLGLLRMCRLLAAKPSLRDQIYVSFDLLARLPRTITSAVAEQGIIGLSLIIKEHPTIIRSHTEWNIAFALLRSMMTNMEASRLGFDFLTKLVSDDMVTQDNLEGLVTALEDFANRAGMVTLDHQRQGGRHTPLTSADSPIMERGLKAIDQLVELKKAISSLAQAGLATDQVWPTLALPLLACLARQGANPAREIRQAALAQLQRLLLGPQLGLAQGEQVEQVFDAVVFPLLERLLDPDTLRADPQGMPETRLRVSNLLCKAFMQFEVRDGKPTADVKRIWIQILDLLDRMMNVDKKDQLHEAVPETLKNVLLVMHAAGVLAPPTLEDTRDERQRAFWEVTQERVDRFLPGMIDELFPPPPPPQEPATADPATPHPAEFRSAEVPAAGP
ncbi:Sec7-like domain is implicated in guanine nucleotide exchange function [Punctularia strigosozonata HHB-11173 SS5]|uniref:Sec7-like domain is implicated in guanine nucleotide exchange function n=1 Tax=Punctularia strigosozonata (strain HHB-11173) TaxID=741275 RepID=UPI0004417F05|nr:Sec7-like domain is implicated in guanine nucleotide exchange function [Punctularia strigosozonata HHB-11173 SS5]EIN07683.1 Sec7-like domain is implicated in guanine nucleotide exchange function [Punctularia strigosozonata HHB-11173 SS5]